MLSFRSPVACLALAVLAAGSGSAQSLFNANGTLNATSYSLFALSWNKDAVESRLGPSFDQLHPNVRDGRPQVFGRKSIVRPGGYPRTNPYELGSNPSTDGDYWSDSGQVGYVPDNAGDAGLDRIQTFAYYDKVFAISPRLDYTTAKPHSDPQTREPYYAQIFGESPRVPVAMVRNYGMQQNEALVLYRDGYLGVAGTQTSRTLKDRPYPGLVFPATKIPTSIAVTTENEFALVTVWDIAAQKGQLAVIALEGKYLAYHTWPYMGLPNQGSWSSFKLLGYVDLPMKAPNAVSAGSNGYWNGPSQTNGLVLSQINLASDGYRKLLYNGGWSGVIATGGYAIVTSTSENMAAVVDLTPLFSYMRESYLSSGASYAATIANRGAGASQFPQTFSVRPSIMPKIALKLSLKQPTTALAGFRVGRWTKDYYKGYVATRDGRIHIINVSSLMARYSWESRGALAETGSFYVGDNPVAMCFARHGVANLPLLPKGSDGKQVDDPLNNQFHVACRGSRRVVSAVTYQGKGQIYQQIIDKRMGDPVALSVAVRGNILTVADFHGRKLLSYRIGKITDSRNHVVYGCGASGNDPFEFAGELALPGYPFLVNSSNVN